MSAAVTEAVARFACQFDLNDAPHEVFTRATRAVIDTVGVTIAGAREECYAILARTLGEEPGEATVLATRERASAAQAALLNGTAGHALDYDDVNEQIIGHPSVVLVSALLAIAQSNGNSGRELLEAYVTGFEIACALARGLPAERHYRRGWHATATIGVVATAAAAGRLLRLDETQLRNALGIAASMASGSRQNFGTMTKPLHAGLAARDAVLAAQLAANGFTADQEQLEAPLGFLTMYGVDPDPAAVVEALQRPTVLLDKGVGVKKYPCCYETHRMADAALTLSRRGVRAEQVRSVNVSVQPGGQRAIIHHRPASGLHGKFSGEYVVAACLLDGRLGLSSFTDDAVARAAHQDLLRRVELREVPEDYAFASVEVVFVDGSVERERCDVPRGDARLPLEDSELERKFRDCLEFNAGDWDADALLHELWRLPAVTHVRDLFTRYAPTPA